MNITAEQVMNDALELPSPLRAFVAEKLIESLDVNASLPLSDSWRTEVHRRCEEMDRGMAAGIEAGAAFAKAYASLA